MLHSQVANVKIAQSVFFISELIDYSIILSNFAALIPYTYPRNLIQNYEIF